MTFIDNLSPEDLLILTNAIAISLSKDKSPIEFYNIKMLQKNLKDLTPIEYRNQILAS